MAVAPEHAPWARTVEACRREFVAVARSFLLIPELIPQPSRDDVALLHGLCRRLDDAVDEAATPAQARAAFEQMRGELSGAREPRPLVAAFLAGAPRSGLPLASLRDLLDGMEQDLAGTSIDDDRDLLRYAYRVSSAVGLMLAPLLGIRGVDLERRVIDLGIALQISNVLLGVRADARRDRVYLPARRLAAAGLSREDVLARPDDPRLAPVLRGLAELGDRFYASAEEGAGAIPLRYRHGIVLLGRVYGELGRRASRGDRAGVTPADLPRSVRLRQLAGLVAAALQPGTLGIAKPRPHDPDLHHHLAGLRCAHERRTTDDTACLPTEPFLHPASPARRSRPATASRPR